MMPRLRPMESRALAVGLLLAVLALAYAVLIQPVVETWRGQAERIETLGLRLAHDQRLAAERSVLEQEHALLSRQRPAGGYYLTSASEALAAAELQAYVKQLIEGAGGGLISVQPILPSPADTRRRVKAQVRIQGGISAVRAVLHGLQAGSPSLLVDEVEIMQGRPDRRTVSPDEAVGLLDMRFSLTGFMKGGGA